MQWGRRHLAAAAPLAGGNRRPLPAAGPRCRRPNAQGAGAEAPPKSAFPCMSWGAVTGASPKGGFLAPGKLRTSQRTRHSLRKCWGFFWAYRAILGGSTVCPQGVSWGIRVEPLWAVASFQHTSEVPNWGEAPPRTREASVRCQGSQNHPIRWWLWSVINKPRTLGWRNTFPCHHLRNPRLLIRACVSFP